jgi:hypothetical protein
LVNGATIWSGPVVSFTKEPFADPTLAVNQDVLTSNVALTRGDALGMYNPLKETGYSSPSPADTQWAFQGLNGNPDTGVTASNFAALTFDSWASALGGSGILASNILLRPGVLHLVSDDIYLDIVFTAWGVGHGAPGGGFAYNRNSEAVVPLPATAGFLFASLSAALIFSRRRRAPFTSAAVQSPVAAAHDAMP